ncbi:MULTISPECIES: phospholipase D family protein [Psychrobacter]|uniref:phospholipase D family protein n=1 Tax=Psychrobacter TaxID=497 RepID=UPI00086DED13|nr:MULTISPECIES: phospholipase D family protein [Psychrobacter]MBA6244176.1 phospholipase D family protein [Psychrobacter sp. Urea-trap-18]MBA6285262.1 phospholipase D family protein [Psychrobacter sp. Urea-trap-16]MBA6319167.1 phospholipase D family protein [Psychrobacter sp. Urea-trap-20]MBA6333849.1 phospholipase D family protein [Psychrobacter sp. Urea-trap-19]OEH67023.1 MAG: phospholipase [Psychrobacter sp. B29-1]
MSMFSIEPSSLSLSLTLGLTLGLSACQSLPKQPHLPESQALSARVNALYQQEDSPKIEQNTATTTNNTDLVAAVSAQNEIHPDLSGYHPIVTGANAFAARSMLTGMATRNIDAQYYIWHNDQAGQLLLKDLWEAAERGVIVRLLLDDFNNSAKFDQHLLRFASHPNIAVRIINPLMHRKFSTLNYVTGLPRINRRMHNKSMTFDKQITIIGGRNIGNEYLSNDQSSQFADLDVLLIGKVVADIDNSFASYWSSPLSFDIETLAKFDDDVTPDFLKALDKLGIDEENNEGSSLTVYKAAIKDSTIDTDLINKRVPFRWTDMQFLSDDVGKLSKSVSSETNLVHQLRNLLGSPTKKLTIISSYFVPTKDGVDTLVKLAESGVDIKILTNSFDATDVTAVHSGYSQWRPSLLRSGVKIYELKSTAAEEKRDNKLWRARSQSSTSLHAKTFAVDDYQVFIGSYNVDPRSANINTEMGVIINDDELARQLHGALSDDLLNQAYEVKLLDNGSLEWHTMEDGKEVVYESEPRVDMSDHIWLTIMSWLPIDWLL